MRNLLALLTVLVATPAAGFAQDLNYGAEIGLHSHHGRYLSARQDGQLLGNPDQLLEWERFVLRGQDGAEPNGAVSYGDTVSLRTFHGRYVIARNDGSAHANADQASTWERFELVSAEGHAGQLRCGDRVGLRAEAHGTFLVAEDDAYTVNANRNALGGYETFTVHCPRPTVFRTPHDSFVSAVLEGVLNGTGQSCALQQTAADLGFRSTTIGIGLEASAVQGLGGDISLARSLTRGDDQMHAYAGGALSVGLSLGADAYLPIGFWMDEPENLAGGFLGGEISVISPVGAKVGVYFSDEAQPRFLGFVVAPAGGVGLPAGLNFVVGGVAHMGPVDLPYMNGCGQLDLQRIGDSLMPIIEEVGCALETVTDAAACGARTVTDAALCGTRYVADAAVCGTRTVTDAAVCGTEWVTDAARCGVDHVTDAWHCGTSALSCTLHCAGDWWAPSCWWDCPEVANSCDLARSCDAPRTCDVPNHCDIANTCDVANTCEISVCD